MAEKTNPVANLTEEQRTILMKTFKDFSDSHFRSEAESEFVRELIKKTAEDLTIPKKLIGVMAMVYHKQNFDEVVEEHKQFELLYKTVVK